MLNINANEYGTNLAINFNQDIDQNIGIKFELQPKEGKTLLLDESNGVSVGTQTIFIGNKRYQENQYVQYTTKKGDIDMAGKWRYKASVDISEDKNMISDYVHMDVLP